MSGCDPVQYKHLKADLHIHTVHSKDGKNDPEHLVRMAIEKGFDIIAVTDHGTTMGAIDAQEAAERITGEDGKKLIVIVGQEIKTRQGEVLAYCIRDDIEEDNDLIETCRKVKRMGGFLIVPHPFDLMRRGIGYNINNVRDYIDAAEGFNERTLVKRFNNKAMAFLRENNIPVVAGSDSHFKEEFGKTYMLIRIKEQCDDEDLEKELFDAIRKGNIEIVAKDHGKAYGLKRGLMKIRTYF